MAAQSYLTDSGDLLKRLTIDEIEKRSLERGMEEGLERGREEGLEQGLERGREEALLEVARKLLARNTPPADMAELTGLDAAAIKNIT
ncbi:MAG: hypothetical protein LBW85_01470 [Deltaproteobacteria bacterium]|jgi:predicted transposase/invertase (TIGR01784 family)|nr:hypothetical protein [Deltaproteobacteria bacterium]